MEYIATLESTFYVIGIVFMSVMLVLVTALVIAVFIIRAKIVALERSVQSKINAVKDLSLQGKNFIRSARRVLRILGIG